LAVKGLMNTGAAGARWSRFAPRSNKLMRLGGNQPALNRAIPANSKPLRFRKPFGD
jgi:hypothetical protein